MDYGMDIDRADRTSSEFPPSDASEGTEHSPHRINLVELGKVITKLFRLSCSLRKVADGRFHKVCPVVNLLVRLPTASLDRFTKSSVPTILSTH